MWTANTKHSWCIKRTVGTQLAQFELQITKIYDSYCTFCGPTAAILLSICPWYKIFLPTTYSVSPYKKDPNRREQIDSPDTLTPIPKIPL
jgi:hypothetical protein